MISIIIATFNAANHIRGCLQSIADQPFRDIEVVVADGAGTDNTLELVKQFHQLNIQWISEPDNGIYDAMNKGTALAKGDWYHFLGADDRLLPDFSKLAAELSDKQAVYYANSEPIYTGNGRPAYELLYGPFSRYRIAKYCINHQAIIYPASVFRKYHYDIRYKVFADWALNIQVWGDAAFKKKYFPLKIVLYNMEGFSTKHKDEVFQKAKPKLVKKAMGTGMYLRVLFKKYKNLLQGKQES